MRSQGRRIAIKSAYISWRSVDIKSVVQDVKFHPNLVVQEEIHYIDMVEASLLQYLFKSKDIAAYV